jgi:crotonobetainyl-CoA:carnitine CoA-transferase CaiB-like acyl-CoA transferase
MVIGPPVFDYATGAMAAFAITSALLRRERTGDGQYLDVSMLDSALMLMSADVANLLAGDEPPDPGRWERQGHPGYRLYDTADGVLMAGAWTAEQTVRFWQVLGCPDRAREAAGRTIPELESAPLRVIDEAQRVLLTRVADEWERLLNEAQVPASRVRTLDEAVADPQVAHRGVVNRPADGIAHTVAAYTMGRDGPEVSSAPPGLGRDTGAILAELGIDAARCDTLRARGVI